MIEEQLLERRLAESRAVLATNDRGDHTVPSLRLFPHQFFWDSAFIAIGMAHEDPERAATELETYTKAQWSNGMFPNQVLTPGLRYQAEHYNLRSWVHPCAPMGQPTSGISQPSVFAEATWRVGQAMEDPVDRLHFYSRMYPRLVRNHRWHFREREMNGDGLISVIHPYETGMDNSPSLLIPIRHQFEVDLDAKLGTVDRGKHWLMDHLRRDLRHVPADERMHNHDVLAYQAITKRIRGHRYDIEKIWADETIPITEDLAYNAIFMQANQKLQLIADTINEDLPQDLREGIKRQEEGFEAFWDPDLQAYVSRDARTTERIPIVTVASLLPLYAYGENANAPHQEQIIKDVQDPRKFGTPFPAPAVPVESPFFDPHRYWAGPEWGWMTWFLKEGVRDHGYIQIARHILKTMLLSDISEYRDTFTGEPLGEGEFSGDAGIKQDCVYQYRRDQEELKDAA